MCVSLYVSCILAECGGCSGDLTDLVVSAALQHVAGAQQKI